MTIDRRNFTRMFALGTGYGILGFPGLSEAATPAASTRAFVMIDHASGRILHRTGSAATRFTPCSTFKIPLALMGFDAGILKDAHTPAWDYDPRVHQASRAVEKQRTDPTSFELNSVIWYSREITRRLGARKFKAYIDQLGYGNRDVTGNPGKGDGLTHSWLMSSLRISPDEQAMFVRRMLARRLMVSAQAQSLTQSILPVFEGSGGWTVHGKTGSGSLDKDDSKPLGWFVGWADKGKRRVVFAKFGAGADMRQDMAGGMAMRTELLRDIGKLAG
jgi:beta-lactamase class D